MAGRTAASAMCHQRYLTARIEQAVAQIDDQIDEHHRHADDQEHAGDDRIVALVHGVEQQQSHAGDDEDLLHDHGAADQQRRLQADQRHDRDQRVAQRVAHRSRCGR